LCCAVLLCSYMWWKAAVTNTMCLLYECSAVTMSCDLWQCERCFYDKNIIQHYEEGLMRYVLFIVTKFKTFVVLFCEYCSHIVVILYMWLQLNTCPYMPWCHNINAANCLVLYIANVFCMLIVWFDLACYPVFGWFLSTCSNQISMLFMQ